MGEILRDKIFPDQNIVMSGEIHVLFLEKEHIFIAASVAKESLGNTGNK